VPFSRISRTSALPHPRLIRRTVSGTRKMSKRRESVYRISVQSCDGILSWTQYGQSKREESTGKHGEDQKKWAPGHG